MLNLKRFHKLIPTFNRYLISSTQTDSMNKYQHQIGFAIDIDGTLLHSQKPIQQAKEALDRLSFNKIPYLLLTNNIYRSEQEKAKQLNNILQLKYPLSAKDIILSFTPMKPRFTNFQNKVVLVIGRQTRLKDILPLQKIPKYITIDEYCTLFPESVPLSIRKHQESTNLITNQLKQRLGLTQIDKCSMSISAVLILTTPVNWQECYQIIIDLTSTQNGTVTIANQYRPVLNRIPIISAFNDMYNSTKQHHLPRLLLKPFNEGLKTIYQLVYGVQLTIQTYGKPQSIVYQYAQKQLESVHGSIEKMVMIGDNVQSDIIGPSKVGWDTILVKTGVAKSDYPLATINSGNIHEGIESYCKLKNIKIY